jgi:hypothetical protein
MFTVEPRPPEKLESCRHVPLSAALIVLDDHCVIRTAAYGR